VTPERIVADIKTARRHYDGLLLVNPVATHGHNLVSEELLSYVEAGADLIILPAAGTVPGVTEAKLATIIEAIQAAGALVSTTISTSQEGADEATIREIALASKRAGTDVFGLGDAGVAGAADPEAIKTLSIAVRGKRHTYVRIARSANR
jgi:S-methylmethionine-dependent homocysteine/selenocysteine methylase